MHCWHLKQYWRDLVSCMKFDLGTYVDVFITFIMYVMKYKPMFSSNFCCYNCIIGVTVLLKNVVPFVSWCMIYRSPRAWHWHLVDFQWVFWMCYAKWKTLHERVLCFRFDLLFPSSFLPFSSYKVFMSVRSPHRCKQDYIHIQHSHIHANINLNHSHTTETGTYTAHTSMPKNVHIPLIYTCHRHPFYLKILTSS